MRRDERIRRERVDAGAVWLLLCGARRAGVEFGEIVSAIAAYGRKRETAMRDAGQVLDALRGSGKARNVGTRWFAVEGEEGGTA